MVSFGFSGTTELADTREENPAAKDSDAALTDTLHAGSGEHYCPTCDSSYSEDLKRCPEDGTNLVRIVGAEDDVIGTVIDDRFTIKARIGGGGMGAVYRALQHSVGREVAVKLIHPRLSRDTVAVKRFLREAKLCSRLTHTGSVMVLDFGQCDSGQLFMVMELLAGRTLADVVHSEGALPAERVVGIAREVCAALEAAHGLNIVHRDLKPSNIMVVDQGDGSQIIKVLDFGLAKSLAGDDSTVTQSGLMMGTPLYTSPEVAQGGHADTRSDLYSLGVIMHELLCGTPPFVGDTMQHLLHQHAVEDPPELPETVPQPLRALTAKLLRKDPSDRFQSATELKTALRDVPTTIPEPSEAPAAATPVAEPTKSSRRGVWIAGALAVLTAAVGIPLWLAKDGSPKKKEKVAAAPDKPIVDAAAAPPKSSTSIDAAPQVVAPDANAAPKRAVEKPKPRKPAPDPKVLISFRTNPSGASVVHRGKSRCVTPCSVRFTRSRGTVRVQLKKTGYLPTPKSFTVDRSKSLPVIKLRPDFLGAEP